MNPNVMLWPLVIHALITMFLYLPMSRARMRSVRAGKVKASVYRTNIEEPEESLRFSNAIRNQNETGLLFYAGVLAAYASGNQSYLLAALAWTFLIVKTVHVVVHVTINRLRYRRPIFMVALFILAVFWVVLAFQLAGIV